MKARYVLCIKNLDCGEAHFDEGSIYFMQGENIITNSKDREYIVTPPDSEAFREYFAEVASNG